jgi:hypothetical protein
MAITKILVRDRGEHIVTYGPDQHSVRNAYVLIKGCDAEQAREIMFAVHGREWCAIYSDGAERARILANRDMNLVQVIEVGGEWRED